MNVSKKLTKDEKKLMEKVAEHALDVYQAYSNELAIHQDTLKKVRQALKHHDDKMKKVKGDLIEELLTYHDTIMTIWAITRSYLDTRKGW